MRPTIKHVLFAIPAALVLASCGTPEAAEDEKASEELHPLVTLEEVKMQPFVHEIRVQGNVETDEDVMLTSEMGGLITDILVKEGQKVSKGQVIARVDASMLASNMQELQTRLDYANYMLEKQKELRKRGVGSEFDLETAQNQVNAIKASMNSVSTQQGKAVIKAPFSGIIDQVFASDGQMAGPASPIARLVNNTNVDITATVSEKHLMNIHEGTPIKVSFPNYSDTVLNLTVTNVGNYIEPTNRTFRIMSSIKGNKQLLPNMLAEVSITDMKVDNGIVISSKAIMKDQDNKDFIFIAEKNGDGFSVKKKIIKVIEKFEGRALVDAQSGLKEGQMVIVEGAKGVDEGDTVRNK